MYKTYLTAKLVTPAILVIALLTYASADAKSTEDAQNNLTVSLEQGQLLSLIAIDLKNTEESKPFREEYFSNAVSLAKGAGYKPIGTLKVTERVVGRKPLQMFVLASWPSNSADLNFERSAALQKYKSLRPKIWNRLDFYKQEAISDLKFSFSKSKFYTLAIAKISDKHSTDYDQYLRNVEVVLDGLNARYFYQMISPRVTGFSKSANDSYRITIVEWQSLKDLDEFQKSDTFKKNYPLLRSGTTSFELARIRPQL